MPRRSMKLVRIFDANDFNPEIGVEVGVQFGKNAEYLLNHYPNLNLLLVDNYKVSHGNHTASEIQKLAKKRISRFEKEDRIIWALHNSVCVASVLDENEDDVDFVFIDAEHTYEAVKADIEAWWPLVRVGGFLTGHDFSARFRGVKRAVIERFGKALLHDGDVWYIRKEGNV